MTNTEITRNEATVDTNIAELSEKVSKAAYMLNAYQDDPRYVAAAAEWEQKYHTAMENLAPWTAQYTGWTRFFLVTNQGGHIHSSMGCSTCRIDTAFAWLPTLSGLTQDDAVDEYGAILCSVCFPDAPVEYTNGTNKKEAARKDAEAAMRQLAKTPEGKKCAAAQKRVQRLQFDLTLAAQYPENPRYADGTYATQTAAKLAKQQAKLDDADAALLAAISA